MAHAGTTPRKIPKTVPIAEDFEALKHKNKGSSPVHSIGQYDRNLLCC